MGDLIVSRCEHGLLALDKRLNEVHLLASRASVDRRLLVVLNELVQRSEPSLANEIDAIAEVDTKVLVSLRRLQGD